MKKLAFVFGALVMGFMITSCGDSLKDSVIKDVETYFTAAEQDLASIDNAEDFIAYAVSMNDRSDLLDLLQEKYGDRTITDEDWEAIENFMEERATAYNHAEAEKCAEFLTPAIDRFEAIVNQMYPIYQAGGRFDQATIDEFIDSWAGVTAFEECENIYTELTDRLDPVFAKEDEMSDLILEQLDEFYADESE